MAAFPHHSLREFITDLDERGRLTHNPTPVNLRGEVAAISRKIALTDGPAVLHEQVIGYPGWRVFTDGLATRERQEWALGVGPGETAAHVSDFLADGHKVKPKLVDDGPCKEIKLFGDDIDLVRLPICYTGEFDIPPFISAGISNAKDPETGWQNTAVRRFQLKGRRLLNHLLLPFQQEGMIFQKWRKRGQPMPLSIVVGTDPLYYLASQLPAPPQVDEMDYWGALTGEPLEVVKSETNDILVPATAEIVIEGEVDLDERRLEGPYSEFTGYYSGVRYFPVIRVKAVTMRRDPIYQNIYNAQEPAEGPSIGYLMSEIEIYRQVKAMIPEIRSVRILSGWGLVLAVSVDKQAVRQKSGLVRKIFMAIKAVPASIFVKNVIVVDDDIDLRNTAHILWAMGVKFQGAKDILVIDDAPGCILDPSEPWLQHGTGYTSITLFDCTEKPPPYDEPYKRGLSVPPASVIRQVDEHWREYGFV